MKEEQEKYKSFMNFSMLDFNQENAIWNFMPINCLAFENNPVRNVIAYGSNGGLNDVLRDELQLFCKLFCQPKYFLILVLV